VIARFFVDRPIFATVISLVIVWTAWDIFKDSLNILLEGLPKGLRLAEVTSGIRGVPGVIDVHDLHVWNLGAEERALSCHVLIEDVPPSASESILRDVLFPLLRKAVNYYLHFLEPGTDGKLHLPATFSPEYGGNSRDCNYDLMLLTWGCRTLLESAELLGIDDELAPRWSEVLAKRVAYPTDANGFMIGADIPFAKSHRHYSHLLWFYPLYQLDVTTSTTNRDALVRSLNHWLGFSSAKQGYTFTGSGSMYAILGNGNQAHTQLITLLDKYVQPNTMYKEAGPVIETPLSGAQTIHDMVLQSWGGTIRVFDGESRSPMGASTAWTSSRSASTWARVPNTMTTKSSA